MRIRLYGLGVLLCAPRLAAQQPVRPDSAVPVRPIEVTVTRGPGEVSTLPFAVTILRGADVIRAGPGLSLSAALATVPGVQARNRYNAARDEIIAIRGFGARSAFGIRGVHVLLDGVPQTLPDGQGQLTNVDMRRIDRVEVLRGASSSLYGNAAGGVVSLWTREPGRGFAPEARVVGGTFGTLAVDAGAGTALGAGTLTVRGSRVVQPGFRDLSRSETWRGNLTVRYPLGPRTTLIAALHLADTPVAEDPGALTADELAADRTQANPRNVAVNARKDLSQTQAGLTLDHRSPTGRRVRTTGFLLRRDLFNPLSFATIDLHRWAFGSRTEVTLPVTAPLDPVITLGADAQMQRDDRVNTSPDGSARTVDQYETVREIGPFVQLRAQPHTRVFVTTGARYDVVRFAVDDRLLSDGDDSGVRSMDAVSGTVGAVIEVHPGLRPYANVGSAFETPTTTELANRPNGAGGFNPRLEPQHATQYELGLRGSVGRVEYSAAAFLANVRGALVPFEVPNVPDRRFFRNAGTSRHRGLELGLGAGPIDGVRASIAYTHSWVTFGDFETADGVFDGNDIPGVPHRFFSGSLRVGRGPVAFDLETRASSRLFVDDANTTRNDAWWTTGARVSADARMARWSVSLFGGIENAFNQHYVDAVAVNAGFGRYYEPAPGRTVFVGAELGAVTGRN
ncbi:MAG TPA: TonB-dependent receptor [Gemmatimonadales bacterium]